jgi:RNA exonuclease 1
MNDFNGITLIRRICVVNANLEVVYSSFVKPKNPITNYLTRFSGITKEMLEDVTTTLSDVQKALIEILPPDAILIGHSLNSDLTAMQV